MPFLLGVLRGPWGWTLFGGVWAAAAVGVVAKLFNMEPGDYKRFLNFMRKHDCQVPFKDYR